MDKMIVFDTLIPNDGERPKGWTDWEPIFADGYPLDAMYKTNFKKIKVKTLTDNIVAESCCCKGDEFDIYFGVRMAYYRNYVKVLKKNRAKCQDDNKLKMIDDLIANTELRIQDMIDSLD